MHRSRIPGTDEYYSHNLMGILVFLFLLGTLLMPMAIQIPMKCDEGGHPRSGNCTAHFRK